MRTLRSPFTPEFLESRLSPSAFCAAYLAEPPAVDYGTLFSEPPPPPDLPPGDPTGPTGPA